ncbi:MAG: FAD-binding oxidoreductase [Rhodospirillales bacterium]|nr:FAD-binding oxidoreductase [Rhodospirillales bacterium]
MTTDYPDIHYARTRTDDARREPLVGQHKAQVCVVGGGLAGLTTALGLAERGVTDVILLEAERVGWGASGRNGGFVSSYYAAETEDLIRKVGLEHTRQLVKLSQDAVNLVRDRIGRYDIACGPNPEGILNVSWYDNPDGLKRTTETEMQMFGESFEYIPRERVHDEFAASDKYFDGLMHHNAFWFHPLNFCLGVARAAEALGVRICEGTSVESLVTDGQPMLVNTERGMIETETVVMTTGAYNTSLVPELGAAFQKVATYVIVTEPLDGDLVQSAIRCHNAISDDRFSLDYYRRLEDNRILWGGRGTTRTTEPYNLWRLMRGDMALVYPQLANVEIETAWSGLMSFPIHRMIQTGELKPGLWYAQGFGGQGMAQTTVAGEALAGAIAQGDDTIDLFKPFGLSWAGGPIGKIYGEAYRVYVRTCDRVTTARARKRAGRAA